jgi:putative sigma-54 modulation protein
MELQVEGRHFKITEAIQQRVEEKLGRLDKYFDGIHRLHVILAVDDPKRQTAELVCTVARRYTLVATGEAEDLYAAIDKAEKKLLAEVRRYKGKLRPSVRGKKRGERFSTLGTVELSEDEEEEEPGKAEESGSEAQAS